MFLGQNTLEIIIYWGEIFSSCTGTLQYVKAPSIFSESPRDRSFSLCVESTNSLSREQVLLSQTCPIVTFLQAHTGWRMGMWPVRINDVRRLVLGLQRKRKSLLCGLDLRCGTAETTLQAWEESLLKTEPAQKKWNWDVDREKWNWNDILNSLDQLMTEPNSVWTFQ